LRYTRWANDDIDVFGTTTVPGQVELIFGRMERTGWSNTDGWFVSDHPVCGVKGGFAEILWMPHTPLLKNSVSSFTPVNADYAKSH
jgi:hypothetical protein